jgi:hypothetical protein
MSTFRLKLQDGVCFPAGAAGLKDRVQSITHRLASVLHRRFDILIRGEVIQINVDRKRGIVQENVKGEYSVDVLIVGSGAGAMTAALAAAKARLYTLIIEKANVYGGTSATSGGGLWIPCNHLMAGVAIEDNPKEAEAYLTALTGNDVPAANVASFIKNGPLMLRWIMENSHVQFMSMREYADYYQHIPGARPGGRSIDPLPFDARVLGDDFLDMSAQHRQVRVLGMMGYTNIEGAVLLSKAPGWFKLIVKLAVEYFSDLPWRFRSRRSRRLTMGNALIGRLRRSLMDLNVPIWLNCPAGELLMEGGGVAGVLARRNGKDVIINAQSDQHEMVGGQPVQYRRYARRRPGDRRGDGTARRGLVGADPGDRRRGQGAGAVYRTLDARRYRCQQQGAAFLQRIRRLYDGGPGDVSARQPAVLSDLRRAL